MSMCSSALYDTSRIVGEVVETRGELEVEWKISQFSCLPEIVNEYYHSRTFGFAGAEWYLLVFPYGEAKFDTRKSLGVYLVRADSGAPINLSFALGIQRADGRREMEDFTYVFDKKDARDGYCSFVRMSKLKGKSELSPYDAVTIVCVLRYPDSFEKSVRKLQDDLEKLLNSGEYSDVVLRVQGKEFGAHCLLLRARAPEILDRHEMEVKTTGAVTIGDLNPEAFPDFLNYLYTGNDEVVTLRNVMDLYSAADKYRVERLKRVCSKCMANSICLENFCEVLSFSILHQKEELTEAATQFFAQNAKEIILTDRWHTFNSENPIIGSNLLMKYVSEQ